VAHRTRHTMDSRCALLFIFFLRDVWLVAHIAYWTMADSSAIMHLLSSHHLNVCDDYIPKKSL